MPRRLPPLLERLSSYRALHIGSFLQCGLYSAHVGDALIPYTTIISRLVYAYIPNSVFFSRNGVISASASIDTYGFLFSLRVKHWKNLTAIFIC
jgi:hypothetical protein